MHGWTGTLLCINLTTRKADRLTCDESLRYGFLGGRGINSRLLYRHAGPATDPLGPDNIIIFGSGPLSGTLCPSSPRCTVTAKSPLTGILGDANFGGFFSPVMKKAGYDHIMIQGTADRPLYLLISEAGVEFRDAGHLWGKTTTQTEALLRQEITDPGLQIAAIGPAGENRVYTACVVHKYNVAGRTGMGAVMGSKNLKAVCVSGTQKIPVAHPELFAAQRKIWLKKIAENPFSKFFGEYGSAGPLDREDASGILAVRNFSQTSGFTDVLQVSASNLKKFFTRSHACFACPVHCIQSFEVTEGPYKGTKGTKLPEGCNSSCGPSCGNTDPGSLFKLNVLANEYGLDILDFGLLMAIAMDWYENGIITLGDTDGISLNWGNHASMVTMLEKIVRREGIGNILADGAVKAARHIGKDAQSYVSSCKGMVFGGVDPRVLRGSALCYATATRGGDHLRGGILFELPSQGKPAMDPAVATERFGTTDVLNPFSYNKSAAANFCQDIYTIADCLQVCKFITEHVTWGITLEDMGAMLYAVTGVSLDAQALRTVASRVFTLERAFLAREGIRKKDDFLQGKWTGGPVAGGKYSGATIDKAQWTQMLEQYYRTRGWDTRSGIPTQETLHSLGLDDVAEDLAKLPQQE